MREQRVRVRGLTGDDDVLEETCEDQKLTLCTSNCCSTATASTLHWRLLKQYVSEASTFLGVWSIFHFGLLCLCNDIATVLVVDWRRLGGYAVPLPLRAATFFKSAVRAADDSSQQLDYPSNSSFRNNPYTDISYYPGPWRYRRYDCQFRIVVQ